jgi:DNA invertase Pin-like site-specific DNA recombinase
MRYADVAWITLHAGLAAVLDHVESNGVKLVVVERADRLARDLMIAR